MNNPLLVKNYMHYMWKITIRCVLTAKKIAVWIGERMDYQQE